MLEHKPGLRRNTVTCIYAYLPKYVYIFVELVECTKRAHELQACLSKELECVRVQQVKLNSVSLLVF